MVNEPASYTWSSYKANGLGQRPKLWTPHRIYQQLGKTVDERTLVYRELFLAHLDQTVLTKIRTASNQGMALGNDRFKQEVESLAGRRVTSLKRGPKRSMGSFYPGPKFTQI